MFIDNVTFTNNNGFYGGAIYFIEDENVIIQNCIFSNNNAQKNGGTFDGIGVYTVDFINLVIQYSNSYGNYGTALFESFEDFYFTNITIKHSNAKMEVGGIGFLQNQNLNLDNLLVYNSSAYDIVGGLLLKNCENIVLQNSLFQQNQSQKGGLSLLVFYFLNVSLNNITLNDNIGGQGIIGNLLLLAGEQVNLNNIYQKNNILEQGAIGIIDCSHIIANNINLLNNKVYGKGGGIYMTLVIDLIINNSIINYNQASLDGGGIFVKNCQQIKINNMELKNNKALLGKGGAIFIQNESQIDFNNIIIQNNTSQDEGGGISMEFNNNVLIKNSNFIDNYCQISGSAINLKQQQHFNIKNSIFTNFKNQNEPIIRGGFISIYDSQEIQLFNNTFNNSISYDQGGALYLKNIQNIELNYIHMKNTSSLNRETGKSQGGNIYAYNIKNLEINNSEFYDSYAQQKGGSLYLQDVINMKILNSLFSKNQVIFDINSYQHIKFDDYYLSFGGAIYYLQLNNITEILQIQNCSFYNNKASSGGAVMLEYQPHQQKILPTLKNNTYDKNMADIGSSIRFLGDLDIQNSLNLQIFNQNVGILDKKDLFQGYYINEKKISEDISQFKLCSKGTYLKKGGFVLCDMCLDKGDCQGGYIPIYPKKNYWRESIEHYDENQFIYCQQNPQACAGNDTCSQGYIGTLCEGCDYYNSYFQSFGSECTKCDSTENIILLILARTLFVFILMLSTLRTLQNRVTTILCRKFIRYWEYNISKDNQTSAVIKILILHNQMLAASSFLKFNIPISILNYVNILGNPTSLLSQSLECLDIPTNEEEYQVVKQKIQIGTIIMSFILLLCIFLIMFCITFGKKYSQQTKVGVLYSAFLVWFLNLQTGTIGAALGNVFCRQIGVQTYRIHDISQECQETGFQFILNLIIFFVCIILIPSVLFAKIYQIKKKGNMSRNLLQLRSFGILYLEYKEKTFYWEFIIMALKTLIIFLATILYDEDGSRNVLTLIILFVYTLTLINLKPYKSKPLNNLASSSSAIQIMTLISSFTIEDAKNNNQFVYNMLIFFILGINCLFLVLSKIVQYIEQRQIRMSKARKQWLQIKNNLKQDLKILKEINENQIVQQYEYNQDSIQEDKKLKLLLSGLASPKVQNTINKVITSQQIIALNDSKEGTNIQTLASPAPTAQKRYSLIDSRFTINSKYKQQHQNNLLTDNSIINLRNKKSSFNNESIYQNKIQDDIQSNKDRKRYLSQNDIFKCYNQNNKDNEDKKQLNKEQNNEKYITDQNQYYNQQDILQKQTLENNNNGEDKSISQLQQSINQNYSENWFNSKQLEEINQEIDNFENRQIDPPQKVLQSNINKTYRKYQNEDQSDRKML